MKILIDNGHGVNTPGKCSPDRRLLEYKYTREIAREVVSRMRAEGLDAELLVPEESDIALAVRCARANAHCSRLGSKNVVLVSIHNNAAGHGQWLSARGWSGWVAPNASAKSKELARILYDEADKRGLRGNRSVPSTKYWVGNFAIIKRTNCPAVLTENLFQDNREDVDFLLSDAGREAIIGLHVAGIKRYVQQ